MQAAGMTHQGHLRARNEDAYWFDERRGFLAIADGLGGHGFGHLASQKAIDFVTRDVQSGNLHRDDPALTTLVQAVNRHIYQLSQDHPGADGMRSTLACLHCQDAVFNCAWLGDSRIYLGIAVDSLQCVSDDHTLFAQKKRQGIRPQPEDKHLLTRSIGGPFEVNVGTRQVPMSESGEYRALLATDGLHTAVTHREMSEILFQDISLAEICEQLIHAALRQGGPDNISVIVAKGISAH